MFRCVDRRVERRGPLRALGATLATAGLIAGRSFAQSVPVAVAANYAIMPGAMALTTTFNSIGVEVRFTGDDNANAGGVLQFKKSTDTTWRNGLPLWRTDDGSTIPGRAFYGS